MELIKWREIAGVKIFEIEVSEDELDVYEKCMRYIHANLNNVEIEKISGAYPDELLGIYDQLTHLLRSHTKLRNNP